MLFIIPSQAKAFLTACLSRSFSGCVLPLHHLTLPRGSRAGVCLRSSGAVHLKAASCSFTDKAEASARVQLASQCKTVPAVAALKFEGGGGKVLAWILGVAPGMERTLNIVLDFLRGGERDINNKQIAAQEIRGMFKNPKYSFRWNEHFSLPVGLGFFWGVAWERCSHLQKTLSLCMSL